MARILSELTVGPGTGVEVSIVEESAAQRPSPPWPYQSTSAPLPPNGRPCGASPGAATPSDPALRRHATGWLGSRRPSFYRGSGEIGPRTLAAQLAAELRWAVDYSTESYAVLNTCRALRWAKEAMLCSKTAGGTWALSNGVEPALVQQALADRLTRRKRAVRPEARAFAMQVATMLEAGPQAG